MPTWVLCVLSIAAAGLVCFDIVCILQLATECWPLTVIGLLNLLYCAAAIAAALVFLPLMTTIGMIYFAAEMCDRDSTCRV